MEINIVTLLGSIERRSQVFNLPNNQQACYLDISTEVFYKKKDGSRGSIKEYHRVIIFNKYAQVIKEKAIKDQKIFIQGRLKTNKWKDKEGSYVKTIIVLEKFILLPCVIYRDMNDPFSGNDDSQDDSFNFQEIPDIEEEEFDKDDFSNDGSWELLRETGWYYSDEYDPVYDNSLIDVDENWT